MKRSGLLQIAMLLLVFSFTHTMVQAQSKDEKAILDLMRLEEKLWNSADIDGYVNLYAPVESTRMIYNGGSGVTYGKDSILAFYKRYWPKERMGQLKLDGEKLEKLSDEYYFVSGFFHVTYPDGSRAAVNGRFSGLMKKINGKWYIYTDHSG